MKLWLDARREPDVDWVWATTSALAVTLLAGGCVERISFAPDQRRLVTPVVDWMIAHNVHPRRGVHRRDGGVRYPRGLLQVVSRAAG